MSTRKVSREHHLISREHAKVSRAHDLLSGAHDLLSREHEINFIFLLYKMSLTGFHTTLSYLRRAFTKVSWPTVVAYKYLEINF